MSSNWQRVRVLVVVTLILLGLICSQTSLIQAESTECLKISEVYPAPASGQTEWIELFNCGSEEIDLTGWQIFDQLTTPSELAELSGKNLPALSYLVINLSAAKLNNTGDGVTIYDQNGQLADQMSYSFSSAEKSWAWVFSLQTFIQVDPTPNQANLLPSPTPDTTPTPTPTPDSTFIPTPTATPTTYPTNPELAPTPTPTPVLTDLSQLQLTEVVACPAEAQNEWLELFWPKETALVMTDWQLTDKQGNVITFSATLTPNAYSLIDWSRKILNNSGDQLTLADQAGQIFFSLALPACQVGDGYALIDQEFQLTKQITKGSKNPSLIINSPTPTPTPKLTLTITPSVLGVTQDKTQDKKSIKINPKVSFGSLKLDYSKPNSLEPHIIDLQTPQVSIFPSVAVIIGGSCITGGGLLLINGKKTSNSHMLS